MGTGAALLLLPVAALTGLAGGVVCGLGILRRRRLLRDWARPVATEIRLCALRRAAFQSLLGQSLLIVAGLLALSVGVAMTFPGRMGGVPVQAFILAAGLLAVVGVIGGLRSGNGWEFDTVVPEAHLRERLGLLEQRARFAAGWHLTSRSAALRDAAALHPGASPAAKTMLMAQYAPGSVTLSQPEISKSSADEIRLRLMGWKMVVMVAGLAAIQSLFLMFLVPQALWDRVFPGPDLSGVSTIEQDEDRPSDEDETPEGREEAAPGESRGEGADAGGKAGPQQDVGSGGGDADTDNAEPAQAGGADAAAGSGGESQAEGDNASPLGDGEGPREDAGGEGSANVPETGGAGGEGDDATSSDAPGPGEAPQGEAASDGPSQGGAPGDGEGNVGGAGGQGQDDGSGQDGSVSDGAQADSDNEGDPGAGGGDHRGADGSAEGEAGDGDIGGEATASGMAEQGGQATDGAVGGAAEGASVPDTGLPSDAEMSVEGTDPESNRDPSAELAATLRETDKMPDGEVIAGQSIPAISEAGDEIEMAQQATDPDAGQAQELSAGTQVRIFAEDGEVPDAVVLELPGDREEALPGQAEPDPPRQILPAWINELVN